MFHFLNLELVPTLAFNTQETTRRSYSCVCFQTQGWATAADRGGGAHGALSSFPAASSGIAGEPA